MLVPLLISLVSATEFGLLSQVRVTLPRPYQSACLLGDLTLFTWTDLTYVWACIAQNSTCQPQKLGPGFRSFALCDQQRGTYAVLAGSNTTLNVYQLTAEGKPMHSVSLQTNSPRDLMGLALDSLVLVVWTVQTQEGDSDINACVLDSALSLRHPVFLVNSFVQGNQFSPFVYRRDTRVQVVWESAGYHRGIFSQMLALDGTKVGSEQSLAQTGHSPVLLDEGLVLLNRSNNSPRLIFGLKTDINSQIPIWEVTTRQEDFNFQPLSLDSDLYLLFSSLDVNGLGSVRLRKSSPSGCILSEYFPSTTPASSYLHGCILSLSAQFLTLLFYDIRSQSHAIQRLSNSPNSVCLREQSPALPPWTKPHLSLEPPWKKPLIVAAGCLGFLLFLAAVIFTAKRVVKRLRRGQAPEEGEIQQSQAKDDCSLVIFEIGTPSTPDKLIKS